MDFERPAGSFNSYIITDAMVEQGSAQRRFVRNFTFAWVRLCSTDDGIFFGVVVAFLDNHGITDLNGGRVLVLFLNDARRSQDHFQFLDTTFNKSLFVFGGFVFGILDQLAAFHGLMQAVRPLPCAW